MKYPKSEPYQRSRHRSRLHALVVAATAVAAIGLPTSATTIDDSNNSTHLTQGESSTALQAQRIASLWIQALQLGDIDSAQSWMHLPRSMANQKVVHTELEVLADMLSDESVRVEPIASRQAGHWALSAWSMDQLDTALSPVMEPVMLYNPVSDGLLDDMANWQVVPQKTNDDAALKPLYNADYESLLQWYDTLAI